MRELELRDFCRADECVWVGTGLSCMRTCIGGGHRQLHSNSLYGFLASRFGTSDVFD